jgi:hypothetical protein
MELWLAAAQGTTLGVTRAGCSGQGRHWTRGAWSLARPGVGTGQLLGRGHGHQGASGRGRARPLLGRLGCLGTGPAG